MYGIFGLFGELDQELCWGQVYSSLIVLTQILNFIYSLVFFKFIHEFLFQTKFSSSIFVYLRSLFSVFYPGLQSYSFTRKVSIINRITFNANLVLQRESKRIKTYF